MSEYNKMTISVPYAGEPIKMDVDKFDAYVNGIERTGEMIIDDATAPVEAANAIVRNATVPTYAAFNERVENVLHNLKTETKYLVKSFHKISNNYCDVDQDAAVSIAEKGRNIPTLS